jgi:hypothetical protein
MRKSEPLLIRFHCVPISEGSWGTHMATKKGPVSSSIPICIGPTEILPAGKEPPWFVRLGVVNETLLAAGGEHVLTRADKGVAAVRPRRVVERRTIVEENMLGSRNEEEAE